MAIKKLKLKENSKRVNLFNSNRSKKKSRIRRKRGEFAHRDGLRKLAKVFMVFFIMGMVLMLAGSIYAFSWLQELNDELPSPDAVYPNTPLSSFVYDRNGKELYKVIGDFNSDPVDIEKIPEYVKWAFLAAEDADFYTHKGFDTEGILRCAFNIASSGGSNLCGASTITQQLIKNTALSNETSKVERKIKELFLSTKVEQQNSKEEILEMYLRVAPFGSNIVGIETASDFYFRKDPEELTLGEAAILASIVQNPARYSPTKPWHGDIVLAQEEVKSRQEGQVLDQMSRKLGQINDQIKKNYEAKAKRDGIEFNEEDVPQITQEEIDEAKAEDLEYSAPVATDKLAGHFVDFVLNELQQKNYKNSEEPFNLSELQGGGYRIYTTLDYDMQLIAEQQVKAGVATNAVPAGYQNGAVMTLQPSTGEIYTMAGSKDFFGESTGCNENGTECKFNPEVNILTTPQSPGSTNKPLAYYLTFEQGKLYAGSFLPDIPITIGGYKPKNWDDSFKGVDYNMKEAIVRSRNIPALIAIELAGIDTYINTAKEWGYTVGYENPANLGPSVVLGGTDILAVEHAAAYAVFANQGDYVGYESILKIEDKDGNLIYEAKPDPKSVASPQATFMLNQTLLNHFQMSSWDGRDVSAKTGTSENSKDNWFAVWSPDFVTIAWTGNNNNDPGNARAFPVNTMTPWVRGYLQQIGQRPPFNAKTPFQRPGFMTRAGGECSDSGSCLGYFADWVMQDKIPPAYRNVVKATVCTDQPDKLARPIDIATGNAEEREFFIYKMPVANWQGFLNTAVLKGKNYNNVAPTEDCDVDRSGGVNGPYFSVVSPVNNATVSNTSINYRGSTFSSTGTVNSLEFFLDGQNIGSTTSYVNVDVSLDISGLGLDDGVYVFRATASDTSGITQSYEATVTVGSATTSNMTITPPGSATVGDASSVSGQYLGSNTISNVKIRVYKGGSQVATLNTNKAGGNYNANWTPDSAGSYTFQLWGNSSGGGTIRSAMSDPVVVP